MSSWTAKAKRDGTSLLVLAIGVVSCAVFLPRLEPVSTSSPSPGAKPFYWALQGIDRLLPALNAPGGPISATALAVLLVAAFGLFYCVWRTGRNRIVALGAAFLLAVHPLARAALASPAGLGDVLDMAILCWALAIAAGPRLRSSRFPNRPPRPMSRALLALLGFGLLTAPEATWMPAIVVLFDLFFQREPDRSALERDWRGYAPHLLLLGLGGLLEAIPRLLGLVAAPPSLGFDHGERLAAVLSPAQADSIWLTTVAAAFMMIATLIGLTELLFTLGRRRTTLPWIGFAGLLLLLTWFLDTGSGLYTERAWRGFLGLAMLLPVLAWRVVVRLLPPETAAPPPRSPGWDAQIARIGLQPLPDLAPVAAAPRLEDWVEDRQGMRLDWRPLESPEKTLEQQAPYTPELQAALQRIGRRAQDAAPRPFDAALARERLAPRLGADRAALLLVPSASPYAAFVAERAGEVILIEQIDGEQGGFPELAGLDQVRIFEQDGRRPWPSRDASIDLVLIADVAERLPARLLQAQLEEAQRVLTGEGRLFLSYPVFERSGADSNALPLATVEGFIELAGLRLVERSDGVESHLFELARGEAR